MSIYTVLVEKQKVIYSYYHQVVDIVEPLVEDILAGFSLRYYSDSIVKHIIASCIDIIPDKGMRVSEFIEIIEGKRMV